MLRKWGIGVICVLKTTERGFRNAPKRNQIPNQKAEHVSPLPTPKGQASCPNMGVDLNGEFHFKVDGKVAWPFPRSSAGSFQRSRVTPELTNECVYVFETPDFNEWVEKLFIDRFGEYNGSPTASTLKLAVCQRAAPAMSRWTPRGASCCPRKCAPPSASTRKSWSWATRPLEIWDADRLRP